MRGLSAFHNKQHDIHFDETGNLVFVAGVDEIADRVAAYMLTHLGENLDDPDFGLDHKVYRERPPAEYDLIRRDIIAKIDLLDGVKMVNRLDITVDSVTREFVFDLSITTESDQTIDLLI